MEGNFTPCPPMTQTPSMQYHQTEVIIKGQLLMKMKEFFASKTNYRMHNFVHSEKVETMGYFLRMFGLKILENIDRYW